MMKCDNLCPDSTANIAPPELLCVTDESIRSLSSAEMTLPVPVPVVDNSVIKGKFKLNNCSDVHVGPKYEHSGDIVINQTIYKSQDDFKILQNNCTKSSLLQRSLRGEMHCCFLNCKVVTFITAVVCLVVFTVVMVIYFNHPTPDPPDIENFGNSLPTPKELEEYPLEKQFVLRENWNAAPAVARSLLNILPVERIILIHTVSAGTCNKPSACKQQVLQIQDLHMDEDHQCGDIGYNFVIGSDGYIYVGCGWDKAGCHTRGFNLNSLGVAFVGDFRTDQPNSLMISSLQRLLEFGVEIHKLGGNYQLYGHCQVLDSFPLSPGKNIMKVIRTWDHWNNTNVDHCK